MIDTAATRRESRKGLGVTRGPMLALLVTLVLTACVYWPGLKGPLVFDDGANLQPINDWLEGRVGWMSVVFGNDSGTLGRSLSMASFVANVALLGPDSWGLKLGNLLIHLINGLLVFTLFSRLLRMDALTRDSDRATLWPAWLAASIWLLHPLLASTVLYVVQRMAMLSALFTLLAMLAYLRGRVALKEQRRPAAYALLALAVPLCTVLATLSKENGILAPAFCGLIELFVFHPAYGTRRAWQSKAMLAVVLGLPAFFAVALTLAQSHFIVGGYTVRTFTLGERLLTETRILWSYVGDMLAPGGPRLGFYHDDFPISHDLLDPATTALAIVGWIATLAVAWRLRTTMPGLALGTSIYLVGHALESSVFPLMLYFEHRNYLPAVGAIWAILAIVVRCASFVRHRLRNASRIFGFAAVGLIAVLAVGTSSRAHVWTNQRSMVAQALLAHPNSRGARFDSITLALDEHPPAFARARSDADWLRNSREPNTRRVGTIERALIDCMSNATVGPDLVRDMFEGPPGPFEEDLLRALEILSDRVGTHACEGLSPAQLADGLARLLDRWERPAEAPNWRLRFRAANLYMAADRNDDAIKQARLAYSITVPANTAVMIAGVLLYCGDTQSATRILDEVESRIRPDDVLAHEIIRDDRARIARMATGERERGEKQ